MTALITPTIWWNCGTMQSYRRRITRGLEHELWIPYFPITNRFGMYESKYVKPPHQWKRANRKDLFWRKLNREKLHRAQRKFEVRQQDSNSEFVAIPNEPTKTDVFAESLTGRSSVKTDVFEESLTQRSSIGFKKKKKKSRTVTAWNRSTSAG